MPELNEYFNNFPIQEPRKLSVDELTTLLQICKSSLNLYKKEDKFLSKREKIDSYKEYVLHQINKTDTNFKNKTELGKYLNLFTTHLIVNHLEE